MAAGFMRALSAGAVEVFSGGSEPADVVNPVAIAAMAEVGIDITGSQPRRWTDDGIRAADVVVTMGCGDTCPIIPGRRYLDWELDDPSGKAIDEVRPIRDEIEERVVGLLTELAVV
jgi:protein-tyrosine-phosphatase